MAETKIIYHMDEEETPYLVKLPVAPERVTLADFKNVLSNRPVHAYKFFFKSMDQDFGSVGRGGLCARTGVCTCPRPARALGNLGTVTRTVPLLPGGAARPTWLCPELGTHEALAACSGV